MLEQWFWKQENRRGQNDYRENLLSLFNGAHILTSGCHLFMGVKFTSTVWEVGDSFRGAGLKEMEESDHPPDLVTYNQLVAAYVRGGREWAHNIFFGEANEAYIEKLRPVADKLFKWLSMGIGLEGHELMAAVGGDEMIYMMKINYYPPCPRPDLALGVVAHTDMSTLTILVPNEVAGLQVFKDDRWYDVKYIPNALIVHIGDQIEILSNGKYKAVLHRTTVNKETTRMSWPVFLEPPPERAIGPIPKLITDENPPKFKTKKYNDYVHCKLNKIPQ